MLVGNEVGNSERNFALRTELQNSLASVSNNDIVQKGWPRFKSCDLGAVFSSRSSCKCVDDEEGKGQKSWLF